MNKGIINRTAKIFILIFILIAGVGAFLIYAGSVLPVPSPNPSLLDLSGYADYQNKNSVFYPEISGNAIKPNVNINIIQKIMENYKNEILISDVPFISQAPLGNWSDMRQEAGCEEASAIMAMAWVNGEKNIDPAIAEQEIIAISDYEQKNYGEFRDTSSGDTVERIYKGYFKYGKAAVRYGITADDIKTELAKGNPVVVPANGVKLKNPHYKAPGPTEHMLVVIGYDPNTDEFITNDPGTHSGAGYHYPANILMDAIYDYKTGYREPVSAIVKAMITVSR